MNTNNFDKSQTGLDLELSCYWDIDAGSYNFAENFIRVDDKLLFIDYGNFDNYFDLSNPDNYYTKLTTKKDLLNAMVNFLGSIDDLNYLAQIYYDKNARYLNKGQLLDILTGELSYADLSDFLLDNLQVKAELIEIHGYSQGNIETVIFTHKAMSEYTYTDRQAFLCRMAEHFKNLVYDQPLFLRLTVNNAEYDLTDYLYSVYDYDKDQIIQKACQYFKHEKLEQIITFLNDNLPDYPAHH